MRDIEPGPGQYYNYKKHTTQTCKTMGIPQSEKPAVLRSASAPSIPSCKGHHFYEEVGDGRLIKKGADEGRSFTGEVGDSVGPGHYGGHLVASHLPRPRGGKFLGSSRPERVAEAPGPGHYELPETLAQQTPIVSSFVSTTVARSEPVKKKKKRQDTTPGPGQYYNGSRSAPNLRDPEFQYFGSTAERFKALPDNGCPGPGTYVARQRVVLKSDWSGTNRFPSEKKVEQPGPGAYSSPLIPQRVSASLLGNTGRLAFGTMESKRGMASGNQDAPGPGSYYEGVPGDESGTGNATEKEARTRKPVVPMSSFRSTTQRDMVKADTSMPPPGAYSPPHIHDVAPVLRVPPRGEGFGSRSTRASQSKAGAAPGPGTYAAEPWKITGGKRAGTFNRTAVEGVPESGRPRGLGFECQASRFQRDPHAERMPGPGSYRVDKEWTKKNYNILYGDI